MIIFNFSVYNLKCLPKVIRMNFNYIKHQTKKPTVTFFYEFFKSKKLRNLTILETILNLFFTRKTSIF